MMVTDGCEADDNINKDKGKGKYEAIVKVKSKGKDKGKDKGKGKSKSKDKSKDKTEPKGKGNIATSKGKSRFHGLWIKAVTTVLKRKRLASAASMAMLEELQSDPKRVRLIPSASSMAAMAAISPAEFYNAVASATTADPGSGFCKCSPSSEPLSISGSSRAPSPVNSIHNFHNFHHHHNHQHSDANGDDDGVGSDSSSIISVHQNPVEAEHASAVSSYRRDPSIDPYRHLYDHEDWPRELEERIRAMELEEMDPSAIPPGTLRTTTGGMAVRPVAGGGGSGGTGESAGASQGGKRRGRRVSADVAAAIAAAGPAARTRARTRALIRALALARLAEGEGEGEGEDESGEDRGGG